MKPNLLFFVIDMLLLQPLSEEEVTVAVNSRKLWSVHLQPLTALLQDTVRQLAGLSHSCLNEHFLISISHLSNQ